MPVNPKEPQIVQHGNTGQIFLVFGPWRREYVTVAGSTATQQINEDINQGVIDRRPGAPAQLLGTNATHFLEGKELI